MRCGLVVTVAAWTLGCGDDRLPRFGDAGSIDAIGTTDAAPDGLLDAPPDAPPSALAITPAQLDFGTTSIGLTSPPGSLTVTNVGGSTSGAIALQLDGPQAAAFAFVTDACTATALAPAASCTVQVVFAPTVFGVHTATPRAAASPGDEASAMLVGAGISDTYLILLSPSLHDFGAHDLGSPSGALTFTLQNAGAVASGPIVTGLEGMHPTDYEITADACAGESLAAGTTCTIGVTFAPTATGVRNAVLRASGTVSVVTAALRGTGTAP